MRFGAPGGMQPAQGWTAVKVILAICAGLFVFQVQRTELGIYLALIPRLFWRGYVWQAFTYQFLHGGFFHILFNSMVLWSFGPELERAWGSAKFTRFFLISGVGGGIAAALGYAGAMFPVVGMSGSIFGLLAAHAVRDPNRSVFVMFVPIPLRIRSVVLVTLGVGVVLDLLGRGGGVAHWAHLGGALTGYLYVKKDDLFRRYRNWYYRKKLERRRGNEDAGRSDYDESYTATEPPDWS